MLNLKRLAVLASIVFVLAIGSIANAAGPVSVYLGAATSFAVLGGTAITNTGSSVINGDIGSSPTATITGFPPGIVTAGNTNHMGDGVTQSAQIDLVAAYNDAAGKTPATTVPTELAGTVLTGGTYKSAAGTFGITGAVTLDGQGDSTSVWVFQMASTLTTATGSSVVLIRGAQACNIFWQVGSSATLGGSTSFKGNVLALTAITLVTGATVEGRLLARNGAVTLDTNTITKPTCAAAPPAATATPAPTATATPSAPTATPSTPTTTPTIVTATPATVKVLPSTSTSADLPLGAISVMLIAIGGALLLLRRTRTSTD